MSDSGSQTNLLDPKRNKKKHVVTFYPSVFVSKRWVQKSSSTGRESQPFHQNHHFARVHPMEMEAVAETDPTLV